MTRVLVVVERFLIAFLAATVVSAMAVPFQTIEKGHYSGIEVSYVPELFACFNLKVPLLDISMRKRYQ